MSLQEKKLWNVKATVIPVLVGALLTDSEELENHEKTIEIPIVTSCLQKAALFGKAFIIRKSLAFQRVGNSQISKHFSCHVVMMLYRNSNNNNSDNNNNNENDNNNDDDN